MNENLENQLAAILEKSMKLAEKSGEFVIDQAPDLLREFYTWHIISAVMGVIISVGVLFLVFQCRKMVSSKEERQYHHKIGNRYYETDDPPFLIYCFIGGLSTIFFSITLIIDIYNLVKITVAPKIYLIEYFLS